MHHICIGVSVGCAMPNSTHCGPTSPARSASYSLVVMGVGAQRFKSDQEERNAPYSCKRSLE